jgi:hypothetical protein
MTEPTIRITKNFDDRLPGKTVERAGYGGQYLWMLFTDGTYVFLDASGYAMRHDSAIHGPGRVEIGLNSAEELRIEKEEQERRYNKYRESEDRKTLADLLEKYPDAVPATVAVVG